MIHVEGLQFSHKDGFELRIPQLSVAPGERVAVVGPSGTGKTTLLNILAGIIPPRSGIVRVRDQTVTALGDSARRRLRARTIGFVFQNFALVQYLSVLENILYPYRIGEGLILTPDVRARARSLAHATGLGEKLRRYPGQLSQGEQQRVAICRALIAQPSLILADEATGNLDPVTKEVILMLLFDQARDAGATILAVTHDHDLLRHFDRVIDFAALRFGAPAA